MAKTKPMSMSPVLELIMRNRENPVTEGEKITVLSRVSKIRTKLTVIVPFFGHLLLKLQPVVTREVRVAGVSRDRKLFINPDWASSVPDNNLSTVLVHEVLHLATLYWDRMGPRTVFVVGGDGSIMPLWNVASDYAINLIIRAMTRGCAGDVEDVSKVDPRGLIDDKYVDWSAEEIYNDLLENLPNDSDGGGRLYMHALEESKADVKDGKGDAEAEGNSDGRMTEAEKRAEDQFWKMALVEAAQVHEQRGQGPLPLGLKTIIDELLDPRVPWAEVLSRWVGENGRRADFTWRRPSRRSESIGEILPSLQKFGVDDVVVTWDTSGSMSGREKEILAEVIGICQDLNLSLRVICCDAAIHSDQSDVQEPFDIDVKGGGGSDFSPAFERLQEDGFQGIVVAFTDGYIHVPEVKPECIKDVLWVIWNSDQDPTNGAWGQVLNVDKEGFQRN